MAGSVQLLLKTTAASKSSKAIKSSPVDEAGEDFKAELTKANGRKNKPADADDDTKKTEKTASAKKPGTKDKSKKSGEEESVEETDSTDAKAEKPKATATESAEPGVVSEAPAEEPTQGKPVAAKEKPADPNAANLAALAQSPQQAAAPTTGAPAEQGDAEAVDPDAAAPVAAAMPQFAKPTELAAPEAAAIPIDPAVAALGEADKAVAIAPKAVEAKATPDAPEAPADDAEAIAKYFDDVIAELEGKPAKKESVAAPTDGQQVTPELATKSAVASPHVAKPEQIQAPPEARFAENNHADIVRSIQTELLPRGGTMQIRLDPPELGALNVILSMKDGVMTASFQASSEDATRMLSHSLSQLKTAMESAGVQVDKLQVQHTPRDTQANTSGDDQQRHQPGQDDMARQQEQQRKEMIKRMWRKLSGESDPLDLVA